VFVHRSAIGRGMFPRLIEGQLVEYEVQQIAEGPQAVAVTPLQGGRSGRGRASATRHRCGGWSE